MLTIQCNFNDSFKNRNYLDKVDKPLTEIYEKQLARTKKGGKNSAKSLR